MIVGGKYPGNDAKASSICTTFTTVAVCIVTYRRCAQLTTLLSSVEMQKFSKISKPNIIIHLIDNDSQKSAEAVFNEFNQVSVLDIFYHHEPTKGVTHARNRAIEVAKDTCDYMCMLDDDEIASANWLEELLVTKETYNADIVTGPSVPVFVPEHQAPHWILKGGFHAHKLYPDGAIIDTAFTNNVLLSPRVLDMDPPIRFDHRFTEKGGEDVFFFSSLKKQGCRIVWSAHAIVTEPLVSERLSLSWILRRGFWEWSCYSYVQKMLTPSLKWKCMRFIKGSALIAIGGTALLPSLVLGRVHSAWALLRIARGLGSLYGLAGYQGKWV